VVLFSFKAFGGTVLKVLSILVEPVAMRIIEKYRGKGDFLLNMLTQGVETE